VNFIDSDQEEVYEYCDPLSNYVNKPNMDSVREIAPSEGRENQERYDIMNRGFRTVNDEVMPNRIDRASCKRRESRHGARGTEGRRIDESSRTLGRDMGPAGGERRLYGSNRMRRERYDTRLPFGGEPNPAARESSSLEENYWPQYHQQFDNEDQTAPKQVPKRGVHVKLGTYKGDSCLETFLARFENIATYLQWQPEDRQFHLYPLMPARFYKI
jgi:hypothetical protein